jgi:RimJ/RimL family protein N-acetyltransferase
MARQQEVWIGPAAENDAVSLVAYMHRLTNEPHNNISLDPGQWNMTVEQERAFVKGRNSDPRKGIFLVAKSGDEVIGIAQLDRGDKPNNQHAASLGISVDGAWRGKGIGTKMLKCLLAWAAEEKLIRIQLKVFSRNSKAIKLYEQFGFVEEGRHPYACCKQGIWVHDVTMGLILRTPTESFEMPDE